MTSILMTSPVKQALQAILLLPISFCITPYRMDVSHNTHVRFGFLYFFFQPKRRHSLSCVAVRLAVHRVMQDYKYKCSCSVQATLQCVLRDSLCGPYVVGQYLSSFLSARRTVVQVLKGPSMGHLRVRYKNESKNVHTGDLFAWIQSGVKSKPFKFTTCNGSPPRRQETTTCQHTILCIAKLRYINIKIIKRNFGRKFLFLGLKPRASRQQQ